jgi:hypothetical protein
MTIKKLLPIVVLFASTSAYAVLPSFRTPTALVTPWHHHLQNFDFAWGTAAQNGLNFPGMFDHAIELSYASNVFYLSGGYTFPITNYPSSAYAGLGRILNHNGTLNPFSIVFDSTGIPLNGSYIATYFDKATNTSLFYPSVQAGSTFPVAQADIDFLKQYGCAIGNGYTSVTTATTRSEFSSIFYSPWSSGTQDSYAANLQSKYIVNQLVTKTQTLLNQRSHDHLFIDDLVRDLPPSKSCLNKAYGGLGSYATWKDGQLDFLKRITALARQLPTGGRLNQPMKVFGNIWTPRVYNSGSLYYSAKNTAKWYATNQLRLDHYYFESGGDAGEDKAYASLNGINPNDYQAMLSATQTVPAGQPLTGQPAYVNWDGGYIPASVMSVAGSLVYGRVKNTDGTINQSAYLSEQYNAAIRALQQGSWFGWYGGATVEQPVQLADGSVPDPLNLVHTNSMMLLRAIPDWENMARILLTERKYPVTTAAGGNPYNCAINDTYTYCSPNAIISSTVVQGWNPANKTLYAVITNATNGKIDLKGGTAFTAKFADRFFRPTTDALTCLSVVSGKASLTPACANRIYQGIIIKFQ